VVGTLETIFNPPKLSKTKRELAVNEGKVDDPAESLLKDIIAEAGEIKRLAILIIYSLF
jgi:hypothetical protein